MVAVYDAEDAKYDTAPPYNKSMFESNRFLQLVRNVAPAKVWSQKISGESVCECVSEYGILRLWKSCSQKLRCVCVCVYLYVCGEVLFAFESLVPKSEVRMYERDRECVPVYGMLRL